MTRWTDFVKEYAQKHNMTYGCAISYAGEEYRAKYGTTKGKSRAKRAPMPEPPSKSRRSVPEFTALEEAVPDIGVKQKGITIAQRVSPLDDLAWEIQFVYDAIGEVKKYFGKKIKTPDMKRLDNFKADVKSLMDKLISHAVSKKMRLNKKFIMDTFDKKDKETVLYSIVKVDDNNNWDKADFFDSWEKIYNNLKKRVATLTKKEIIPVEFTPLEIAEPDMEVKQKGITIKKPTAPAPVSTVAEKVLYNPDVRKVINEFIGMTQKEFDKLIEQYRNGIDYWWELVSVFDMEDWVKYPNKRTKTKVEKQLASFRKVQRIAKRILELRFTHLAKVNNLKYDEEDLYYDSGDLTNEEYYSRLDIDGDGNVGTDTADNIAQLFNDTVMEYKDILEKTGVKNEQASCIWNNSKIANEEGIKIKGCPEPKSGKAPRK